MANQATPSSLSTLYLWMRYGNIKVYPCYYTQPDNMAAYLHCGPSMSICNVDAWYQRKQLTRQSDALGHVGYLHVLTPLEAWKKWAWSPFGERIHFEDSQ